jgi:hypothetical protein
MLEITGYINGETLQNKLVSADELAKLFGVTVPEKLTIEANKNSKKTDRYGNVRSSVGVNLNTSILGTFQGNEVQILYYTRKPYKDGIPNPQPKRMRVQLPNSVIDSTRQKEIAVFTMLHPKCEDSPIKSNRVTTRYKIKNRAKEAQAEIQRRLLIRETENKILLEKNEDLLRRIALGIRVNRQSIGGAQNMTMDELKAALLNLFEKNPYDFANAYSDVTVKIKGLIQEAKMANVIKLQKRGNIAQWIYTENEEEIVNVSGKDKDLALMHFLSDAGNFEQHYPRLEAGIKNQRVDKNALAAIMARGGTTSETLSIENMTAEELFRYAKDANKIMFYPEEMRVALMDDGIPGNTLLKIDKITRWETELIEKLKEGKITFSKLRKHCL